MRTLSLVFSILFSSLCFSSIALSDQKSDFVTIEIMSAPPDTCGEIIIPTAFTPNGDGVNDVLKIYCECAFTIQYSVYSRWGNLVFETSPKSMYWDGTKDGDIVESGVYYISYKGVYLNGEEFEGSGDVTLMR